MKQYAVYVNDGLSGYLASETLETAEREADRLWRGNPVVSKIELIEMLPTPHTHSCEQCGVEYMECSDVNCGTVVDGFCDDDCAMDTGLTAKQIKRLAINADEVRYSLGR